MNRKIIGVTVGTPLKPKKIIEHTTIVETANGNHIVVTDSADKGICSLEVHGKSEQTGEPSPEFPQEIKNVGVFDEASGKYAVEIKTTGKNLLKNTTPSQTIKGVTFTANEDGSVHVKGTSTGSAYFPLSGGTKDKKKPIPDWLIEGENYTVSGGTTDAEVCIYLYKESEESATVLKNTCTMPSGHDYHGVFIYVKTGVTVDATIYPMIRKAEVGDDTYEPYKESTVTVYLDEPLRSKDVLRVFADGTGEIVRTTRCRKISAADEVSYESGLFRVVYRDMQTFTADTAGVSLCSHYINSLKTADAGQYLTTNKRLIMFDSKRTTLEEWKELFRNNDVYIEYPLATPTKESLTAEQVNALLQLQTFKPTTVISNNADTDMTVEYVADTKLYIANLKAQHDADIEALKTAIIALGGTV